MFVLVDPINREGLDGFPYLGTASLLGTCRRHGIPAHLIQGQPFYLPRLLCEDLEQTWPLIDAVGEGELDAAARTVLGHLRDLGPDGLAEDLPHLYAAVYERPGVAASLTRPQHLRRVALVQRGLLDVLGHHAATGSGAPLPLVDAYVREIRAASPRVVGFSLAGALGPVMRLVCQRLKAEWGGPVIAGGSITPYLTRAQLEDALAAVGFDAVVVGAAEEVLPELVDRVASGRSPAGLPNVCALEGGRRVQGERRVVEDLDALAPPDFTPHTLGFYPLPRPILPLETARGCTWRRCAFCAHEAMNLGRYRRRSVEAVVARLEALKDEHGVTAVHLNDAQLPARRARRIAEALLERGLGGTFQLSGLARLEPGFLDPGLLETLQAGGFQTLQWGLESGSQPVLDAMDKGVTLSTAAEVLAASAAHGLSNQCFVFFGFPGETRAQAEETVSFLEANRAHVDLIAEQGTFQLCDQAPIGQHPERWQVTLEPGGRYQPPDGALNAEEADAFLATWKRRLSVGEPRVESGRFGFWSRTVLDPMLAHLLFSHDPLPWEALHDGLTGLDAAAIYPLLAGAVTEGEAGWIWQPMDLAESTLIHQLYAPAPRPLGDVERRVVEAADGHHALAALLRCSEDPDRARAFLEEALRLRWGLAFRQPW